jgi:hypothetical protein
VAVRLQQYYREAPRRFDQATTLSEKNNVDAVHENPAIRSGMVDRKSTLLDRSSEKSSRAKPTLGRPPFCCGL